GACIPHIVDKRKPEGLGAREAEVTPVLTNARGHVARALGQAATATDPYGIQECIMSPAKRDAKKQAKARQRRRRTAQERLARDRRQAQHAAKVVEQALQDLGLPDNLVAEIEGRLRSQQ